MAWESSDVVRFDLELNRVPSTSVGSTVTDNFVLNSICSTQLLWPFLLLLVLRNKSSADTEPVHGHWLLFIVTSLLLFDLRLFHEEFSS